MITGIQGKISLLVFLATAASALLVSRGVADKSLQLLREHELVDLGDEASLRGWTLSDKVEGLAEDLVNLNFSIRFNDALTAGISQEGLSKLAQESCRRFWDDYLYIDVVQIDADEVRTKLVHRPVRILDAEHWLPDLAELSGGGNLHLSPIQRVKIKYPEDSAQVIKEKHVPIIWGMLPLTRFALSLEGPRNYLRIATKLSGAAPNRQFFVLENDAGEILLRSDELVPEGEGNDDVFRRLRQDPVLKNKIKQTESANATNPSRVQRLVLKKNVPLDRNYYFLEGVPNRDLESAIEFEADLDYLNDLRQSTEHLGRVGGLGGAVREIRLLADSKDNLKKLQEKSVEVLRRHFPQEFDGIEWRETVECDEIHSWAVHLFLGAGENLERYLIHFAVMEDELASSIKHEMKALQTKALFIAGGAGILGFLIAMIFISPLKEMTQTAQQITDSGDENLPGQLGRLISSLKTNRRDEVGDIARASKRLFEEVMESQEKLERRVADRTSDLRKANIELEQANDQLKSLSHEKDAFVAKVSHDLRQPLNAIFLQVEALKLSELDDLQKQDVEKIHSHATRELNLVNDILEYQKIIMGAEKLIRDDIEIAPLAEELRSNYLGNVQEGVELTVSYPEDIGSLEADSKRLSQIVGNLISNACKFTKEGKVSLEVEPRKILGEDWVEFIVTDTGRGMSPDEQSKAFVPFVSNKKDNAGGTGLGLSICKELTERMGGRIGFVSELGSGTSFSVLMPRKATSEHYEGEINPIPLVPKGGKLPAATPEEAAERIAEHAEKVPHGRGAKILVIDDDASVRELLKRLLEEDGYVVLTAEDGATGIEVARRENPEAITLDVVMPGEQDGWAVLKELKNSPETEQIPVIMVSIMAEADNGFALDVEDYLVKPVDIDRLSRVVSRVTHSSPQRNLLIVDDDTESSALLSRLLKDSGWQSALASNGIEALEILKKTRPAAIVLDLMMPEMDGFEFLRTIQDDEQLNSIPVIVMTGKEPTPDERIFLEQRVGMILKKDDHSGSKRVLETITQRIRPH